MEKAEQDCEKEKKVLHSYIFILKINLYVENRSYTEQENAGWYT